MSIIVEKAKNKTAKRRYRKVIISGFSCKKCGIGLKASHTAPLEMVPFIKEKKVCKLCDPTIWSLWAHNFVKLEVWMKHMFPQIESMGPRTGGQALFHIGKTNYVDITSPALKEHKRSKWFNEVQWALAQFAIYQNQPCQWSAKLLDSRHRRVKVRISRGTPRSDEFVKQWPYIGYMPFKGSKILRVISRHWWSFRWPSTMNSSFKGLKCTTEGRKYHIGITYEKRAVTTFLVWKSKDFNLLKLLPRELVIMIIQFMVPGWKRRIS